MNKKLSEELVDEIHPSLNSDYETCKTLSAGSNKVIWWLGSCSHEWEARVSHRSNGSGCPFCAGQKVLVGFNDLASKAPKVAAQWHPTKNGDLTPDQVVYASSRKVWWLGECGHEWYVPVKSRTVSKTGCGVCKKIVFKSGLNDLATIRPDLLESWSPENTVSPSEIPSTSMDEVLWVCPNGHTYAMRVAYRVKGRGCTACGYVTGANKRRLPKIGNSLAEVNPDASLEWDYEKNNQKSPSDVNAGSSDKAFWVCLKGHSWEARISDRCSVGTGCPECFAESSSSKMERELYSYVKGLTPDAVGNARNVIPKLELDIFVPSRKIAIEFNGLYWHSEAAGKDKTYHRNKRLACKEQGIQLIQIWEDEWVRNPGQVKRMIAHKLGLSDAVKVPARKTIVINISQKVANDFLNVNHVQGAVDGSIRVGLVEKEKPDSLVAVMVLKKEKVPGGTSLNLLRFATKCSVAGGFTKLLSHVVKMFSPQQVVTFSDNCVSDGGLYRDNGFVAVKELPPDYMYVVRSQRVHKFNYRLNRFRNDPTLEYVDGYSERQLAQLNKLPRIWDAGKVKWVYTTS